jgi:molecular chaperone DnaJ
MNTHDACALLGVPIGASELDVKMAFKKKAIEFHPDRNKAPDAEDKFKKINEAFQLLEKFGTNPPAFNDVKSPFYNTADHLAEELRRQMDEVFNRKVSNIPGPPIAIKVDVSFEMSIIGGRKEVSYSRFVKCFDCSNVNIKSVCVKCNGTGKRKYGNGAVQAADNRELPCNGCKGTGYSTSNGVCQSCKGTLRKRITEEISVPIPPGIENGTVLTFNGKGNYRTKDIYDGLAVLINVQPNKNGLTLDESDVISTVELSLLEAIQGTKKSIHTIKGNKVLEFKPKIKNGDRIRVSGFGVPPSGAHIVVISVNYPDDVSELIAVLEKNKPPPPSDVETLGTGYYPRTEGKYGI